MAGGTWLIVRICRKYLLLLGGDGGIARNEGCLHRIALASDSSSKCQRWNISDSAMSKLSRCDVKTVQKIRDEHYTIVPHKVG